MNFVVILAAMTAFWHRGSAQISERKGKFLGFSTDELWSDFLDEVEDPLPMSFNTISVKDKVLQKLQKNKLNQKPTEVPPLPLPQLVQELTTMLPSTEVPVTNIQPPRRPNPVQTSPEPFLVYDSSTHKFELTPPGFASHPAPITEGMFVIGGQFGQQSERPQNMTGEGTAKLFWGPLGDVIESTSFLPIQVNVPDLLAAMASFFAERIPFINQANNPSRPRPNAKVPDLPEFHYPDLPAQSNLLEYRQMVPTSTAKPKKNKKRKQNKKKSGSRKRTTEGYRLHGTYESVTQTPKIQKQQPTSKNWFAKSTAAPTGRSTTPESFKLFNHNNSPDSDKTRYKNMPIIRKNNRWADREIFNFKHSDISNSPIMILNMPSRPVLMYKFQHEQKTEFPIDLSPKRPHFF